MHILQKIDKLITLFVWNNKPPKVKKSTIVANYADGGLKMPDIFVIHTVAKVKWIKKLVDPGIKGNWQNLFLYLLNIKKNLIKHKLPRNFKSKGLTPFHKQVLECWEEFHGTEPNSVEDICNELIFDNKFICSDNDPLKPNRLNLPNSEIVQNLKIYDLINVDGKLLIQDQFYIKCHIALDNLSYNKIVSSIPRSWKEKLKLKREPIVIYEDVTVRARGALKQLSKINNKSMYWIAVDRIIKEPTAVETWINEFPFLVNAPWHKIFAIPHKISPEPYVHSFQYKIVNRILNCGVNLHKWKIRDSPLCTYCNNIDSIEH